jgi:hypothetical protein
MEHWWNDTNWKSTLQGQTRVGATLPTTNFMWTDQRIYCNSCSVRKSPEHVPTISWTDVKTALLCVLCCQGVRNIIVIHYCIPTAVIICLNIELQSIFDFLIQNRCPETSGKMDTYCAKDHPHKPCWRHQIDAVMCLPINFIIKFHDKHSNDHNY